MGAITQWVQRALAPRAQVPVIGGSSVVYSQGRAAKVNVRQFRHWARHSPWVRGAIDIRKNQIASADFEIVPFNVNKPYSKRLAAHIKSKFDRPNPRDRSFRAWITPIMEDLMTLDSGCFEIVGSLMDPVEAFYYVDPEWVRVSRQWDGSSPRAPRYFWYPNNQYNGVNWSNQEFGYLMQNPTTYSPLGISPLEVLWLIVDAELSGSEYNRRLVQSAVPDGLLHLGEGVPQDKVDRFRSFMSEEVLGKGAMAITGGGKQPIWLPFRQSNRDMQFREWQQYLVTQIAVAFGLSVQDLQQLFDINRATGDVQSQLSEDRGLRPLADLIQDELTQQIVQHPAFGGPDNNLRFAFTQIKIRESYDRARTDELALARMPKKTINEARVDDGREPIGDLNDEDNPFNSILAQTSQGMVRLTKNPADIPTPSELAQMKAKKSPASATGKPSPSGKSDPAMVAEGPDKESN